MVNEMNISNENESLLESMITDTVDSSEIISDDNFKETSEKLETKGLKLKKSTKEKLNLLQGKFTDAETMINTLISQYETFNIKENSKYADRKAEIDKFNYFLDSLRKGFLNSLEMSTYLEDRYNEKLAKEIKNSNKIIASLQEDNLKLKELIQENTKERLEKEKQLDEVKESFSRVNMAMIAIEKELGDKANIINSLKSHIESLTTIVEEGKQYKKLIEELSEDNRLLKEKTGENELIKQELKNLSSNNLNFTNEIITLKTQLETERESNLNLNNKIQEILISKNDDINNIREKYENDIRNIESDRKNEYNEYKDINFELREKIYKLENELQTIKLTQK